MASSRTSVSIRDELASIEAGLEAILERVNALKTQFNASMSALTRAADERSAVQTLQEPGAASNISQSKRSSAPSFVSARGGGLPPVPRHDSGAKYDAGNDDGEVSRVDSESGYGFGGADRASFFSGASSSVRSYRS
jgi:hypothetical protein